MEKFKQSRVKQKTFEYSFEEEGTMYETYFNKKMNINDCC